LMMEVLSGPVMIILVIAELAMVWTIAAAVHRINASAATVLFLLYAAINGLVLSAIFVVYTGADIASAFIASAAMFGAMSVYGMVTKTDLTRLGSILFMALIGLIVASIVNVFMASSELMWIISYAGVAIFCGLTAYDTQRLRYIAVSTAGDAAMAGRLAISGALALYLDFINLFLFLLQIMANSRRR
ncbi:MAG TPA: Bax inhibitor-1/YccA family protein, partial [Tepidisphaeraceae bacterium]|nr:Bax inhibitor-1/YccA family protein [Tepidisphaeraceae bacterium]